MPSGARLGRRVYYAAWCALTLLLVVAGQLRAAEPTYPQLSGRVVDEAGILDGATVAELTELLAHHEKATGEQVVVVTLKSLQGLPIEDFGYQLGRHWGIGQKGKNTGAILIVAPTEHKVRVEVGYGLEGTLTDAISRVIIERDILPTFRSGDFNGGVVAGTKSILKVLGGDSDTGAESSEQRLNKAPYIPWATILLVCVLLYLQFRARRSAGSSLMRRVGRSGGYIGYPGGFGGFGGGGGGGGGFSGGGGSFGGGGASGSW
jgi:uncharacterized protein